MAELADALDLGSSAREGVGVQVSPGARRISEMRTRFSDLVFSYWGNLVATAAASRAVYGRPTCSCWRSAAPHPPVSPAASFAVGSYPHSMLMLRCVQPCWCWFDRAPIRTAPYLPGLALPCFHLRLNPPVHAGVALAPCLLTLRRFRQPPSQRTPIPPRRF